MRTTLTIDDDVAVQLERLRQDRHLCLREVVNRALREGLVALQEEPTPSTAFVPRTADLGTPRFSNLDDVQEVLAAVEGDDHR